MCTAAFKVVRYVVEPCDPEPKQFLSKPEATQAALRAARRYGVANVYKVNGEPVTNLWCAPELLATYQGGTEKAA